MSSNNNIDFYLHADALTHHIRNQSRIFVETIQQYQNVIIFYIKDHHIYFQPQQDLEHQWFTT